MKTKEINSDNLYIFMFLRRRIILIIIASMSSIIQFVTNIIIEQMIAGFLFDFKSSATLLEINMKILCPFMVHFF